MRLLDIMTSPWAIVPAKLQEVRAIYQTHMRGEKINLKGLQPAAAADPSADSGYDVQDGVAIIPVVDVLTKNRTFFSMLFGGTSMRDIADAFTAALDDPAVHSIILAIDSPGGTVDGTEELARTIHAARGTKKIVALADGLMTSAAYWIGAAADEIYIGGETTEVGSIGVVATHIDYAKQDEMYGEKWTEITAGKYKRPASAHKPLSEDGRAYIQAQVDDIYKVFVDSVAKFRGLSVEQALEAADGKIFMGQKAADVGLVDGIATLPAIISQLKEEHSMDLKQLQEKHPELYRAVREEGRTEGLAEGQESARSEAFAAGKAEGLTAGAETERLRIQGVESALIPGHEQLIETMKFDGKTTAAEAAQAVIVAERQVRNSALADIRSDAAAVPVVPNATLPEDNGGISDNLPLDQQAKAEWEKSPDIRKEFADNFAAYLAYRVNTAAGRIRILGRK